MDRQTIDRVRMWTTFLMAVAFSTGSASAQISTTPTPVGSTFATNRSLKDLDCLTTLYNGGRWKDLQTAAMTLLDIASSTSRKQQATFTADDLPGCETPKSTAKTDKAAAVAPKAKAVDPIAMGLDYTTNYVVLTWIGEDAFGKSMLDRVVVHSPTSEPFAADLPGVGVEPDDPQVFEVFLSRGTRGKLVTVYASTRDKNPIAEQLPAFVQAIANPLFAAFGVFAGDISGVAAPAPRTLPGQPSRVAKPPTVAVTVRRVGLPFRRATIAWKAKAKEPLEIGAFRETTDVFTQQLMFEELSNSKCVRTFIGDLGAAVKWVADDDRCASDTATVATCKAAFDEAINTVLTEITKNPQQNPPADLRVCFNASKEDREAIGVVDKKFRDFVTTTMTTVVEADVTFKNRPLTHWTFGMGGGVLTNASLTLPRVKVKDGSLVADPLTRVVTTTFANWSPAGYDAELERVTAAERVRPFFGAVITPDFGLTAGLNVLLARGIGVTAAGAFLFAKGAEPDQIGKAPANADQPFSISYARGVLLGISYNFK